MEKILEVRRQTPERKIVAYETSSAVYVSGSNSRSGCYHKSGAGFSPCSYEDSLFRERDGSVKASYTPLYEGDQIVISEVITL